MHRRTFLTGLAISAVLRPAVAQQASLTAAEISALLTGNTALGLWLDVPYRQWFGADGSTIYAAKGQRSTLGKWRVDAGRNLYESWWVGGDWEPYGVVQESGQLFWTDPAGDRFAFDMVEGKKLVWER